MLKTITQDGMTGQIVHDFGPNVTGPLGRVNFAAPADCPDALVVSPSGYVPVWSDYVNGRWVVVRPLTAAEYDTYREIMRRLGDPMACMDDASQIDTDPDAAVRACERGEISGSN